MNTIRLSTGAPAEFPPNAAYRSKRFRLAGITSTMFVALFLLVLPAACGSNDAAKSVENEAGRNIYLRNCVTCHGDPVTGKNALPGTPIHGPEGHTWHHPDRQLKGIIDGSINFPGRTMPSFGNRLTPAGIESVLAYIKAGWTPEQLRSQREVSGN